MGAQTGRNSKHSDRSSSGHCGARSKTIADPSVSVRGCTTADPFGLRSQVVLTCAHRVSVFVPCPPGEQNCSSDTEAAPTSGSLHCVHVFSTGSQNCNTKPCPETLWSCRDHPGAGEQPVGCGLWSLPEPAHIPAPRTHRIALRSNKFLSGLCPHQH